MKKISLVLFLILVLTSFSAQKTGIAKYDNLQYSKGETVAYFNFEGYVVTRSAADFERKIYPQGDNLYIVADYFTETKEPAYIFETTKEHVREYEPSGSNILNGVVIYYQSGKIATFGTFEGSNIDNGTVSIYDENGNKLDTLTFQNGEADF